MDAVQTIHGRGTYVYLAPELRALPANPHTLASDIYSFGIVLWELFQGRHIEPGTFDVRSILRGIGSDVELVIRACLNENPKQRPTIFAIVDQLETLFS
jgi:serine/threonine protein kinase